MRTAALFVIAVLFASAVRAAAPNPADWYTPEGFKDSDTKKGTWNYNGDPVDVMIKEDGTVTKSDGSAIDPPETQEEKILFDVYKNALQGAFLAERNKKRIETLGQNLNDLLMFKGFEISDFNGGKYKVYIGDGTQSIKDYLGAKGNVPAVSTQKIADGLKPQLQQNSDYKFLLDLRSYVEKKIGKLEYCAVSFTHRNDCHRQHIRVDLHDVGRTDFFVP